MPSTSLGGELVLFCAGVSVPLGRESVFLAGRGGGGGVGDGNGGDGGGGGKGGGGGLHTMG